MATIGKTTTNLARLQATQNGTALPSLDITSTRDGVERGAVASDILAGIEGDQRFLHVYTSAGPQAPTSMLRAPASAWQAAGVGQFDGMSWNVGAQRGDGVNTLIPGAFVMDGTVGVGADFVHTLPRGEITGGPLLGVWTDQIWAGGGVGYIDEALQIGVRLGLMGSVYGHNACEVTLPGLPQGAAQVYVAERRRWQISTMPAASFVNWLRLLFRFDHGHSSENLYDATVDRASARLLSREHTSTLGRWFLGTWRALWGKHPLPIPALEHPERLRPGEARECSFGVRNAAMGSLGAFIAFTGYQRAGVRQSKLRLERNAGDVVSVTWTQTKVVSHRGFGVIPGGLGADWGRHKPQVKAVTFSMQLDRDALAVYRTFVEVLKHTHNAQKEDAAFAAMLAHPDIQRVMRAAPMQTLSEGISRGGEMGTRLTVFPSSLWQAILPTGFALSLAANNETRQFSHTVGPYGQDANTKLNIRLNQRQRMLGPAGIRQNDVVAVVEEKYIAGKLQDATVVVGSRFHVSRADASEAQQHIVNPLNNHFDAQLGPLQGAGWRVSRDVSIERRLGRAEFVALATLTDLQRDAVREKSGVNVQLLDALVHALQRLPLSDSADPERGVQAACLLVQAFVQKAGLPALGALRHALGAQPTEAQRWTVTASSDAYEAPADTLGSLRTRALNAKDVKTRSFARARRRAEVAVDAADALRGADPFLDAQARTDYGEIFAAQHAEIVGLGLGGDVTAEKGGFDTPQAAALALEVQRFLRKYSEPRYLDDAAAVKSRAAFVELERKLRAWAHDPGLDLLVGAWVD